MTANANDQARWHVVSDAELVLHVLTFSDKRTPKSAADHFGISIDYVYRWRSQRRQRKSLLKRGLHEATRELIIQGIHKLKSNDDAPNVPEMQIFGWFVRALNLPPQSQAEFEQLIGKYQCYRLYSEPGDPSRYSRVVSELEFKLHPTEGYPAFFHKSAREADLQGGIRHFCFHQGFVFVARSKIYLLSVGTTFGGEYFRTMILRFANPRHEVLGGIVLTETKPDNAAMATRIALLHEKLDRRSDVIKSIDNHLEGDLYYPHILYGWGPRLRRRSKRGQQA